MYELNEFARAVAEWHEFYVMMGTAAATLVGLLFVSLSLNSHIASGEENAGFRVLAMQAFSNFLFVLLFAVIFLIPGQRPLGLGLPLLGMGAIGLCSSVARLVQAKKTGKQAESRSRVARQVAISGLCHLALLAVAVSVLYGQTRALHWLVPVMILLIEEASRNAWDLLIKARVTKKKDE